MALTLGRMAVNNNFRRAILNISLNSVKGQRFNNSTSTEERKTTSSGKVKTKFPPLSVEVSINLNVGLWLDLVQDRSVGKYVNGSNQIGGRGQNRGVILTPCYLIGLKKLPV